MNVQKDFCLTAQEFYEEIAKKYPDQHQELITEEIALIIFPTSTLNYLKKETSLKERKWIMNDFSLYAFPTQIWTGEYKGCKFNVVKPPMGDSAVAAVAEQLIVCGVKKLLLVCGAWGLQNNQPIGDLLIPTLSKAQNKVAESYGASEELTVNRVILDIILEKTVALNIDYLSGTNIAFESFYKIPKELIKIERKEGAISAENGELHTLIAIANYFQIDFGAIFYNYYKPLENNHLETPTELFSKGGKNIARIALDVIRELDKQ